MQRRRRRIDQRRDGHLDRGAACGQSKRDVEVVAIRVKGLAGAALHTENRVPCGSGITSGSCR